MYHAFNIQDFRLMFLKNLKQYENRDTTFVESIKTEESFSISCLFDYNSRFPPKEASYVPQNNTMYLKVYGST